MSAKEKAARAEAQRLAKNARERAARAAKKAAEPARKAKPKPAPKFAGHSPTGKKSADAPKDWPFGTQDPPAPPPPPAPAVEEDGEPVIPGAEPLDFLQAVINETRLKLAVRLQAAALAVAYKHAKPAPMGKKEARQEAAKKVSRFAASAPPKLVVNNRS